MQIAKYFATFGIKVDQKSLDRINTILKKLEGHVKKYHAKIDTLENKTTTAKIKNLDKVAKHQNQKMDSHVYLHKKHLEKVGKQEESAAKKRLAAISRIERSVKYWTPPVGRQAAANKATGFVYKQPSGYIKNASAWLPSQGSNMRSQFAEYYGKQAASNSSYHNVDSLHARALRDNTTYDYNRSWQGRASNVMGKVGTASSRAGAAFRNTGRNAFMMTGIVGSAGYLMNTVTDRALLADAAYRTVLNSVQSVGGSKEEAQKRYQEIIAYSKDIGINYLSAMPDYAKMIASGVGIKGTTIQSMTDTFKAYTQVASAFNLTPEQTKLFLRGVTQSISKNKLMAEEYTGQILEHAPVAPAYQEGFRRMQEAKGIILSKDEVPDALRAEMKAGNVNTIELNKYMLQVFKERYLPLVEEGRKGLAYSVNNFQNAINESFDPFTNPESNVKLKAAWNSLTEAAVKLAPVLTDLAVFFAENFSVIINKLGSWFGIDVEAQKRDKAYAAEVLSGAKGNTGIFVPTAGDLLNTANEAGGINGFMNLFSDTDTPTKKKMRGGDYFRERVKSEAFNFLPASTTAEAISAWADEQIKSNGAAAIKVRDKLLQSPNGDSNSAAKSVTKSVVRKLPSEMYNSGGQGITFNGDIHVTTPNSESFTGDLLRKTMSFKGTERVA